MQIKDLFRQTLSPAFYISGGFFLVCMSLDFYITNTASYGDYTREANAVGKIFWQLLDSFRYVEIPLWVATAFAVAYIVNFKSKFLALLWLNVIALNHLFGFLSWLPYGTLNFIYSFVTADWALPYAFSLVTVPLGLVITFLQTKMARI